MPTEIKRQWIDFFEKLVCLNQLSIHRRLFFQKRPKIIELHSFADASEKAYEAVIYMRGVYENNVTLTLFCAKGKVTPLKKQILARLELCAALLLSKLVNKVLMAVNDIIKFSIIHLWSDNEITLCWIQFSSKKWQIFVPNRVEKIQG